MFYSLIDFQLSEVFRFFIKVNDYSIITLINQVLQFLTLQNYKISSYFGARFKDFNLTGSVAGNLSSIECIPELTKKKKTTISPTIHSYLKLRIA